MRSEQSDHLNRCFKSIFFTLSVCSFCSFHDIAFSLPFPKMCSFVSSGLYLSPGALLLLWCHKSYLEQDEGARPTWYLEAVKNSVYLLPPTTEECQCRVCPCLMALEITPGSSRGWHFCFSPQERGNGKEEIKGVIIKCCSCRKHYWRFNHHIYQSVCSPGIHSILHSAWNCVSL